MRNQEIEMQKKKAYHKPEMEVVVLGLRDALLENTIPVVIIYNSQPNK